MTGLVVAVTLVAALMFACASVAQQSAAAQVPEGQSLVGALTRSPRWWAGLIGDGGGYLFQMLALGLGTVLVVQPVLVSMLLFALPLSAKFSGFRMTRGAWALATTLACALVVFLVVGNPTEGNDSAEFSDWIVPGAVVLGVIVAAVIGATLERNPGIRALLFGTASGLLYGVAVALTKAVIDLFDKGLSVVLSSWQSWTLVAAGAVGVFLQQKAFQVGPLSASLPAITIGEPIAAVFLGMTVLDERLRTSGLGVAIVVVAIAAMVVTAVGLSRSQAGLAADAHDGAARSAAT